jgi:O-antigen/teichoic acid export membrane protein
MATIQHAGAVVVLWLVSPTIVAYFSWQILVNVVQTVVLRQATWRSLDPAPGHPRFRSSVLRRHWRFAAGMTGISVLSIVLTQSDKLILSKLLPLATFGTYMVALNLSNGIPQLVTPLFAALFPRFTQLLTAPDREREAATLYHQACQTVSAIMLPAAALLIAFPREILLLWTRDPTLARNASELLRLLVIGSALNALMFIPLVLQLASGWTRLVILQNAANVVLLVPLMVWLVNLRGAVGGALVWILVNAGYVLVMVPLVHRRLLKEEMWRWYRTDVAVPLLSVAGVVTVARLLLPGDASSTFALIWLAATAMIALAVSTTVSPFTRDWLGRHARLLAVPRAPP